MPDVVADKCRQSFRVGFDAFHLPDLGGAIGGLRDPPTAPTTTDLHCLTMQ